MTARFDMSKLEIAGTFADALAAMEERKRNLFITGKAGTGKSTLLSCFREKTKLNTAVVAPTGVAAVNIAGQTLHSFFGFRPDITLEKARRAAKRLVKNEDAEIYQKLDTLIIDEISMVRADIFDCVDAFLRVARGKKDRPFGGVHLVMIGDLYQLPPVVTSRERPIFEGHYTSPYFFDARSFADLDTEIVELDKIYRQSDKRFIDLLNAIRNNSIDDDGIAAFNERYDADFETDEDGWIHLTSLNREADAVNDERLARLRTKPRRYRADVRGEFDRKSYPTDEDLVLKNGTQVMLLNNDAMGRWINGTIGTVAAMDADGVTLRIAGGGEEYVEPFTWKVFHYELDEGRRSIVSKPVGSFTQLPLMHAWAVTIHKSQGKTFERAIIDIGRTFAAGQTYVALSRLKTLEGMVLKRPLKKGHVRVDWRVVKFMTGHRYAESEANMPFDEKVAMIESAIREGRGLSITYLKSDDTKSERVIKPIEVGEMEYKGRPFPGMTAICSMRGEQRTFRVDRILEMKFSD
jgi:ATP-dependent DNA helicase PIF1